MKQALKFIAAAAIAALAAGQASAVTIFDGNYNGGAIGTYVGTVNPTNMPADIIRFGSAGIMPAGLFTERWVFDFAPGGSFTVNANFIPGFPDPNSISGFNVSLFSVSSSTCAMPSVPAGPILATVGGACSALSLGGLIAAGTPSGPFTNASSIGFTPLLVGRYAYVVSGNVLAGGTTTYSGQTTSRAVPEPGSLALVGAALLGLAFTARKRKQA